jgi:transposase
MSQAGELYSVPYVTVRKWVTKVKNEGINSLVKDERGRPEGKELNKTQESRIIKKLIDKTPDQLKLRFGLWTRETVSELIWREYGIRRSVWQIGRYLKEWGFTPQKPVYKSYEQNSELVNKWLKKTYPAIRTKAQKEGATIFWGDETGVRSTDVRGRSFAPKGQTPTVMKTGKQFGITMISALTNRGKIYFMFHKGGVNSDVFIKFMKKLILNQKNKTYLIVDNLPSHKTNKVKEWVFNNRKKIQLFYLPPYSPELNPDEYLNQDLKVNITGKVSMTSVEDLKNGVRKFMNKRKSDPAQVKKYFHHQKVKYAA